MIIIAVTKHSNNNLDPVEDRPDTTIAFLDLTRVFQTI